MRIRRVGDEMINNVVVYSKIVKDNKTVGYNIFLNGYGSNYSVTDSLRLVCEASETNAVVVNNEYLRLKQGKMKVSVVGDKKKNLITLYHGSEFVIKNPDIRLGKTNNDYGKGFYLTPDKNLAGEWAVSRTKKSGYINKYELDYTLLRVLDLNKYSVDIWISILMTNRKGGYRIAVQKAIDAYVGKHIIDISKYDVIVGWRADDSYFAVARDFVTGLIDGNDLIKAVKFGGLGLQWCIKSEQAYRKLK
jgi:hypothetical protein